MHKNTIIEARDASFFEKIFTHKALAQVEARDSTRGSNVGASESLEEEGEPWRSKRARKENTFWPRFSNLFVRK